MVDRLRQRGAAFAEPIPLTVSETPRPAPPPPRATPPNDETAILPRKWRKEPIATP
ncbi:MAG: hypothetical protein ACI8RZ_007788, partial [Myxococcota bacterium]